MNRNIVVSLSGRPWIEDEIVEVVERKGLGHPDTLCDGIAERISVAYCSWCSDNGIGWLHHNFDKVQLVAGGVSLHYGGGQMLRPIRIQIAGRGTRTTPDGRPIPVETIAIAAAKEYLDETLRYLDPARHCVVDCYAGGGASQLVRVVEQVAANDTSFGVAHWPLSELEHTVLEVAGHLNHTLINEFPIGEDIKVMGRRLEDEVMLTCAVPFICTAVPDLKKYKELKSALCSAVESLTSEMNTRLVEVAINTGDDEEAGSVYLTLTGTSAECGDDGAVGRGNRVTGLITPMRSVSMEAAAGKNPISHAGKIYNLLALEMAKEIVRDLPGVKQVEVVLLSQIGQSLQNPLVAYASILPTDGRLTPALKADVQSIVDLQLANVADLGPRIIRGELALF